MANGYALQFEPKDSEPKNLLKQQLLAYHSKLIEQDPMLQVGLAVYHIENTEETLINDELKYPMQSVFKLHLSMAVLYLVDQGKLSLNQIVTIAKKDYIPNTHSPIADKYPEGASLPLSEVLAHTAGSSDNNGCDALFALIGGPKVVDKYLKKNGIKGLNIVSNERVMQADWDVQFKNWSYPSATSKLLLKLYNGDLLKPDTNKFLMDVLLNSTTGPNRIKGLLPKGTAVAHKTGSSGANAAGIRAALNDVGIVYLPNGDHVIITAFVGNSKKETAELESIIAELSKIVYDYYVRY